MSTKTRAGRETGDGLRRGRAAPQERHSRPPSALLALVDSNHHSQIQSLLSCHWTKGQ